jgi:hypothetical protein
LGSADSSIADLDLVRFAFYADLWIVAFIGFYEVRIAPNFRAIPMRPMPPGSEIYAHGALPNAIDKAVLEPLRRCGYPSLTFECQLFLGTAFVYDRFTEISDERFSMNRGQVGCESLPSN